MRTKVTAYALSLKTIVILTGMVLALAMGWNSANAVVYASTRVMTGYDTDIRVWLEEENDIYASEDNLVFYIRAARDCYTTVYVVDTDGFIHVIHPLSPYDNAFVRGGVVYRFNPYRSDIFYSDYPRGIAYVFAVSSPVPFVYADFGFGIFGGTSSYRIYGDPFIACKQFYISILPRWVVMDRVSISFSHFYIREWARFPHYLCGHRHWAGYEQGRGCDDFDYAYRSYRLHYNNPYSVLRPGVPIASTERNLAKIVDIKNTRVKSSRVETRTKSGATRTRAIAEPATRVRTTPAVKAVKPATVKKSRARAQSSAVSSEVALERRSRIVSKKTTGTPKTAVQTSAKTSAKASAKVSAKASAKTSAKMSAKASAKASTKTSAKMSAKKTTRPDGNSTARKQAARSSTPAKATPPARTSATKKPKR